jgi:hypothetical protein
LPESHAACIAKVDKNPKKPYILMRGRSPERQGERGKRRENMAVVKKVFKCAQNHWKKENSAISLSVGTGFTLSGWRAVWLRAGWRRSGEGLQDRQAHAIADGVGLQRSFMRILGILGRTKFINLANGQVASVSEARNAERDIKKSCSPMRPASGFRIYDIGAPISINPLSLEIL